MRWKEGKVKRRKYIEKRKLFREWERKQKKREEEDEEELKRMKKKVEILKYIRKEAREHGMKVK